MKIWKRIGRHRLSVDLVDSLYQKVKRHSQKRNITVTKWLSRAIVKALIEEEKFDTTS